MFGVSFADPAVEEVEEPALTWEAENAQPAAATTSINTSGPEITGSVHVDLAAAGSSKEEKSVKLTPDLEGAFN